MNKVTFLSAFVIPFFLLTGCNLPVVKGNGNIVTQDFPVGDFDKIKISAGSASIDYVQSDNPVLSVRTDENIFEKFDIYVDNRVLYIKPKNEFKKATIVTTEFVVKIQSSALTEADLGGSVSFDVNGPLKTDQLKVSLAGKGDVSLNDSVHAGRMEFRLAGSSKVKADYIRGEHLTGNIAGSGTFNLGGTLQSVRFDIAGSGKVNAFDLEAETLACTIAGSGRMDISVSREISADIAGSGKIRYRGNPEVNRKIAGSGSITKVD